MRTTAVIGVILLSSMVGVVLTGDRSSMNVYAQEETGVADTNLSVAVEAPSLQPENMLPEGVDPGSALGQLARLVQAGVDQGVILAYVENSPRFFELDTEGIIYLTELGTPPDIIEAAIAHDQKLFDAGTASGESAEEIGVESTAVESSDVTVEDLEQTLSPYGSWIYVEGYGRCWRPSVGVYDRDWQPYSDNGQWVYTDRGWYWKSNYSWGWAAFHYGRWFQDARHGWCWWPDTVWAPSWVHWRYNSNYCGWAPLPPYTAYRTGVGLVYRGQRVSVGFNFNLADSAFTFVSTTDFCAPNLRLHRLGRQQVPVIFRSTTSHHRIKADPRRRGLVNYGIPTTHLKTATRKELTPVSIEHLRKRLETRKKAVERIDPHTRKIIVNRPAPKKKPAPAVQPQKRASVPPVQKRATPPAQVAPQKAKPKRTPASAVVSPAPVPKVRPAKPAARTTPKVSPAKPPIRTKPQVVRPTRKPPQKKTSAVTSAPVE
jgi:hypothetical protein